MAGKRVTSVEGLRGVAAAIVLLHHFFLFFYPAYFFTDSPSNTTNGIDLWLGQMPLAFFLNGNSAVIIFLVITGFGTVLASQNSSFNASKFLLTRYFKLFIMCVVSTLPVLAALKLGWLCIADVSLITGFPQVDFHFTAYEKLLLSRPLESLNAYAGLLWPMKYFFYGTMLAFIYGFCLHRIARKSRANLFLAVIFSLIIFLIGERLYLAIALGCFLGGWYSAAGKPLLFFRHSWLLLAIGMLFCGYPSSFVAIDGFYGNWPCLTYECYHIAGAALLVYCALGSAFFIRLLNTGCCQLLGRYSMAVYLVQAVIIYVVVPKVFLLLPFSMSYYLHVFITLVADLLMTALGALLLQYVMQFCFRWLDRLYAWAFS